MNYLLACLGVVLCTLKFFGLIDISWWIATAPFWVGIVIVLALWLFVILGSVVHALVFGRR